MKETIILILALMNIVLLAFAVKTLGKEYLESPWEWVMSIYMAAVCALGAIAWPAVIAELIWR